ncbi:hypothetical protein MN116_005447 [Schistosoma mekongi]|uniref:Uncharacterized protein n=1 Tax=Schistosoma mekongi TaxID=38744 RepID=A0AAE2D6N3_SCHME|nr:hypothetical protein MN116_005447 [Schistosoma mekongi]
MSVTDLRGQPLAVRITSSSSQTDSIPSSWNDLNEIEPINNRTKYILYPTYPIGQRLSQSETDFNYSSTHSRDNSPNLYLHVNNNKYFSRNKSLSPRCFTRASQYHNRIIGLDSCYTNLSENQLNYQSNSLNNRVECQIDKISNYENSLGQHHQQQQPHCKHNIEINFIHRNPTNQMCIPQKKFKIKSCEFLNESILSCNALNPIINKSTNNINNDGSEYSHIITTLNNTTKYHRKNKISSSKQYFFKGTNHICIPSKKLIKIFKFKRKSKDTKCIIEKFGTSSKLELAKAVKTLSDVGQSLVEHTENNCRYVYTDNIQQASCSHNATTDIYNIDNNTSNLSIHIDTEEKYYNTELDSNIQLKDNSNNDIFHPYHECLQITPIPSADFSDSGLWSMSQIVSEDCTNSLHHQQHTTSCSESPMLLDDFIENNNSTNETRLQKAIVSSINLSTTDDIQLLPWLPLKVDNDSQQEKELILKRLSPIINENELTGIDTVQYMNEQTGVPNNTFVKNELHKSLIKSSLIESYEALNLPNDDLSEQNLSDSMRDDSHISSSLNLKSRSDSITFGENKNGDFKKSSISHISILMDQSYPQENCIISSSQLSQADNIHNISSSFPIVGQNCIQFSTFQQNLLISSIDSNTTNMSTTSKISDLSSKQSENEIPSTKPSDIEHSTTHFINDDDDNFKADNAFRSDEDIKKTNSNSAVEQQNSYSSDSSSSNIDQFTTLNSQIDIIDNSYTDLYRNSSDITPNPNSDVILMTQIKINSMTEPKCASHHVTSSFDVSKLDDSQLNKSLVEILNDKRLQFTDDDLPKVSGERLTAIPIIGDAGELLSSQFDTLFKQQKIDQLNVNDMLTYEQLSDKSSNELISDQLTDCQLVRDSQLKQFLSSIVDTSQENIQPSYLTNTADVKHNDLPMIELSYKHDNDIVDSLEINNDFSQIINDVLDNNKQPYGNVGFNKLSSEEEVLSTGTTGSSITPQLDDNIKKFSYNHDFTPIEFRNKDDSITVDNVLDDTSLTVDEKLRNLREQMNNTVELLSSEINQSSTDGTNSSAIESLAVETSFDPMNLSQPITGLPVGLCSSNNNKLDTNIEANSADIKSDNESMNSQINDFVPKHSLQSMEAIPSTVQSLEFSALQLPLSIENQNPNSFIGNNVFNKDCVTSETGLSTNLNELHNNQTLDHQLEKKDLLNLVSSDTNDLDRLKVVQEAKNKFEGSIILKPLEKQIYHQDPEEITLLLDKKQNNNNNSVHLEKLNQLKQTTENISTLNDYGPFTNTSTSYSSSSSNNNNNIMITEPSTYFLTSINKCSSQLLSDDNNFFENKSFMKKDTSLSMNSIKHLNALDISIPDRIDDVILNEPVVTFQKEANDFIEKSNISHQKATNELNLISNDKSIVDDEVHISSIPVINAYKEKNSFQLNNVNLPEKFNITKIKNSQLSNPVVENSNDKDNNDNTDITISGNEDILSLSLSSSSSSSTRSQSLIDKTNFLLSNDRSDHIELDYDNSLSTPPPSRHSEYSDYSTITNTSRSYKFDLNASILKLNSLLQYENHINNINHNHLNNNLMNTNEQKIRSILIDNTIEHSQNNTSAYIYNSSLKQLTVMNVTQNPIHTINDIYIDDDYIHHLSLEYKGNHQSVLNFEIDETSDQHKSNQRFIFTSHAYSIFTAFFNLATLYVPRHLYWLYGATFTPREQFHRIMAGHGTELHNIVLRHPLNVAGVFIGFTLASPYLRTWPYLLSSIMNSTEINLFNPFYWIDRPVLEHIGCLLYILPSSIRWGSTVIVSSFKQYPWSLANPSKSSSSS